MLWVNCRVNEHVSTALTQWGVTALHSPCLLSACHSPLLPPLLLTPSFPSPSASLYLMDYRPWLLQLIDWNKEEFETANLRWLIIGWKWFLREKRTYKRREAGRERHAKGMTRPRRRQMNGARVCVQRRRSMARYEPLKVVADMNIQKVQLAGAFVIEYERRLINYA